MKFSDNVSFAVRDLNRRKKRTLLTSIGIIVGTILILLMVSLGIMLKGFLIQTIDSGSSSKVITVEPFKANSNLKDIKNYTTWIKTNFNKIDNSTLSKISKISGVNQIQAYISGDLAKIELNGNTYNSTFPIVGYDLNYSIFLNSQIESAKTAAKKLNFKPIIAGNTLTEANKNDILVGESLLKNLDITNPNDIVGKQLTFVVDNINGTPITPVYKTFTVAGVISKDLSDGNKIIMDSENAASLIGVLQYTNNFMDTYGYNAVKIETNSIGDVSAVQNDLNNLNYKTSSNESTTKDINKNFNNITLMLSILGVIVLIVAAIGIINTMIMAVHERTKSIGVMKSLGASSFDILSMFLFQSAIIGFIGSIIGSLVSFGLFKLISYSVEQILLKQGFSLSLLGNIPWWLIVATIAFSVIISLLAGIYPAVKASKLDPIEALRH